MQCRTLSRYPRELLICLVVFLVLSSISVLVYRRIRCARDAARLGRAFSFDPAKTAGGCAGKAYTRSHVYYPDETAVEPTREKQLPR